jgi:DNA-binding MarR family transcriptional regulator
MTRTDTMDLNHYLSAAQGCVCFNLRKAARAVTQVYDAQLKPSGLKATQLSLLAVLASAGPITVKQLAERLVMDRTTLTRNLKPLERDGLIRSSAGEDRRTRSLVLTRKGQAALLRALPLWEEAQTRMLARLGAERWQQVRTLLGEAMTPPHAW